MWCYRILPVVLVMGGVVLLTGARGRPGAALAPSATLTVPAPPLPSSSVADVTALRELDTALLALEESQTQWLETAVWQKVQLPELTYEAEGHYWMGPAQRFRLEMNTHLGATVGSLLLVSDGTTLWQARRAAGGDWEEVSRWHLEEVLAQLHGPSGSPQLRLEMFQNQAFSGIVPLLRNLRQSLVWAERRTARRGDHEMLELTGVWAPSVVKALSAADQIWPAGLPRQCRLFLNGQTHWLERIEWWGPATNRGGETLLAQMEFRQPVRNTPPPPRQRATLFTFHPGQATVTDRTAAMSATLAARAEQLAKRTSDR